MSRPAEMAPEATVPNSDPMDAIERYFDRGWTDGLPVVPPTEDRVAAFLSEVDRDPAEVLVRIPETGRQCTVGTAAINAVMAGCRPEYFPLVLSAVEGWGDERWGAGSARDIYMSMSSTGGAAQLLVVNGPIREEIDLNSGINALGPGHRANSTIGRALRLIVTNAFGMASGVLDMSTIGHPGKYSMCLAEHEEDSPWPPLSADHGFGRGDSTVAVFSVQSPISINGNSGTPTPESVLVTFADAMGSLSFITSNPRGPFVVVLAPVHAHTIASHGWNKSQVQEYLWETAKRPLDQVLLSGNLGSVDPGGISSLPPYAEDHGIPYVRTCRSPRDIVVVVGGGNNGGYGVVLPPWGLTTREGEIVIRPVPPRKASAHYSK